MAETKVKTESKQGEAAVISEPRKRLGDELVKIYIPIYDRKEAAYIHVIINGKHYWMPRGKEVTMPRKVATIVEMKLNNESRSTVAIKKIDSTDIKLH